MVVGLPILILNAFGGIVSGIWLVVLGQWWAIGYGISALFAPYFLGLIMMVGLVFAAPGAALFAKGRRYLALPFLLLNSLFICAVITIWCVFVFDLFISGANPSNVWPLLIWSFGVAVGPWTYMAQQEADNEFTGMTAFFAEVAYLVMVLTYVFEVTTTPAQSAAVFGVIMMIGSLFETHLAYRMEEEKGFGLRERTIN
jgi:hypothetical protein